MQVGRCFEDPNVIHVENRVDPVTDIATVTLELCLKDLETVNKRLDRARKMAKSNDPKEKLAAVVCEELAQHLDEGEPAAAQRLGQALGLSRLADPLPTFQRNEPALRQAGGS